MKYLFTVIFLLFSLASAQDEAGQYSRSSLTYIGYLLKTDSTIKNLTAEYNRMLVNRIGKQLNLSRYDKNEIPKKLHEQFAHEVQATEQSCAGNHKTCLMETANLMNRVVAPPIMNVVAMNKEIRAQNLMTEEQKNSFITDKAKELGFTADEVKRVMNSAYIFLPIASNFEEKTWKDTTYVYKKVVVNGKVTTKRTNKIDKINTYFSSKMKMGLAWWKISAGDSTTASRLWGYEPIADSGKQTVNLHKVYKLDDKKVDPKVYARTKMIASLGGDFGERLRAFEDFKLSGQVIERSPNFVGIDIGAREGIVSDDVFWIMESIEDGGKTTTKKAGWVLIRDIADSNSTDGYKSSAKIIGGRPYVGAVLKEHPMSSTEAALRFQSFIYHTLPVKTVDYALDTLTFNNIKLSDGMGPRLEIGSLIAKNKVPQLYMFLGAGFSIGKASGSIGKYYQDTTFLPSGKIDSIATEFATFHDVKNVIAGHYDIFFMKRFYMRRVAISIQTGFGFQHTNIILSNGDEFSSFTDTHAEVDTTYHLKTSGIGGFSNGFAEIAITPGLAIGGGVGYRYFGSSSRFVYETKPDGDTDADWEKHDVINAPEVNYNGMTWSAYITLRPAIKLRK